VIGYANALIDELRASGTPLLLPIEIYADKIRRSQFGVEHVPEVIERVAKAVSSRQQLFDVDSMPWRGLQLGGDAQLEALAFYSQLAAVQVGFGLPALQAMQRRLALHGGWQPRYRWVEQRLPLPSTSTCSWRMGRPGCAPLTCRSSRPC
jgi:hypothetical protein